MKEQKLLSLTINNTDNVMKTCGHICKTVADVDELITRQLQAGNSIKEALLSQVKYYKSVNRGLVKGSLFFVTSAGQPLTSDELAHRLKDILQQIECPLAEEGPDESCELDKQQQHDILREKLLSKLKNSTNSMSRKRKCPFPDDIHVVNVSPPQAHLMMISQRFLHGRVRM